MTIFRLCLKAVAITFATFVLAGVAVFLAQPRPIENAMLGAEWQCSRTAFVLTTCAPRVQQASPAAEGSSKVALRAPKV
jgi:hypothetical protein